MENLPAQTNNNQLAPTVENEAIKQFRLSCQQFLARLNQQPPPQSLDSTPDGKAQTVLISHIEMSLDEFFFGLWETENFKWSVIANEIVGSIDLIVVHPVTNQKLRRSGAAAIQIMVDKVPDGVNKNQWANDPNNKKPNALDMGFPKLKAECLKNAAQSFGKLFGRDLNRKKADNYNPLLKNQDKANNALNNVNQAILDTTSKVK